MRKYEKVLHISSFSNFKVSVYVIGYRNVGESILILFKDSFDLQERVVFAAVVDCYKKEKLNVALDLLKKNEVNNLDLAFWTHPHDDHSPGFDELVSSFPTKDMMIFLPRFDFSNFDPIILQKKSKRAKKVYDSLVALEQQNGPQGSLLHYVYPDPQISLSYRVLIIGDNEETKECEISFLTPVTPLIDAYGFTNCPDPLGDANELSLSFVLSLDGYDFYFGGDAENTHIKRIDKNDIANMRWVKVPHHCSDGGTFIAENLVKLDCAASTVYSSQLPRENIQKIYKEKAPLFMTQLKDVPNKSDYGVIQFDYKFKNDEIEISPTLYGNAGQYK